MTRIASRDEVTELMKAKASKTMSRSASKCLIRHGRH